MKRRVIMLQKKVTSDKECLKCAHENGCTLGYFGNVRVLSGTSEHVRSEHVRSEHQTETGISDQKKKIGEF